MTPIRLTLFEVGPFASETVIDFSNLGPLFLISGDTGSGKSTIFDAIMYALYGRLTGTRDAGNFVTAFITPSGPYVALEFVSGARHCLVKRSVRFMKEKKGKLSEVPDTVSFEQDGSSCPGKKSEINAQIAALLGISASEFEKIVLVPQGAFQNFLEANTSDKLVILKRLFPIDEYERITDFYKDKLKELRVLFKQIELRRDALSEELGSDAQGDEALRKKQLDDLDERLGRLRERERVALASAEKSRLFLQKKQRLAELAEMGRALALRADEIDAMRKKFALAGRLSDLRDIVLGWERATGDFQENENKAAALAESLSKTDASISDLEQSAPLRKKISDDIEAGRRRLAAMREGLEQKKTADLKQAEAARLQLLIKTGEEKSAALGKSIVDFEKQSSGLEKLRAEAEDERMQLITIGSDLELLKDEHTKWAQLESLRAELSSLINARDLALCDSDQAGTEYARVDLEFRKDEALRVEYSAHALSLHLTDGEPCPVCGSLTHPAPAAMPAGQFNDSIRSEQQRAFEKKIAAQRSVESLAGQIEILQVRVRVFECAQMPADRSADIEKLNMRRDLIQKKLSLHTDIPGQLQLLNAQKNESLAALQKNSDEITLLSHSLAGINGELTALLARDFSGVDEVDCAALEASIAGQSRQIEGAANDLAVLRERSENLRRQSGDLNTIQTQLLRQLSEADSILQPFIKELGITSVEQMRTRMLSSDEISALSDSITAHEREMELVSHEENILNQELSGYKDDDASSVNLQNISDEVELLQKSLAELIAKDARWKEKRESYDNLNRQLCEVEEQGKMSAALAKTLSGDNPRGLPIASFVMSRIFDQVLLRANQRLALMTRHRYVLIRNDSKRGNAYAGLDLDVCDLYNGSRRPSGTLSGGEKFLASLSLALGMADTVQSQSGALRIESFFIDEGFGSLDAESLDLAVNVLNSVRGNRSVGIISHVASLKEQICAQIVVTKRGDRSTVETRY